MLFVLSPQNPFKEKKNLLDQYHRLQIIRVEIEDNQNLDVSTIEFDMPTPSYTIDTLVRIQERNPQHEYALIMCADNIQNFHKWKNHEQILQDFSIYVYPRANIKINIKHENICLSFIPHPLASCNSPEGLIYIFSSTKSSKLKFLRSIFRDLPFCCNLKKRKVLLNIILLIYLIF